MGNITIKDYVHDDDFIAKMNAAFSDLRADYELSMDADKAKINELTAIHVDVKNQLSDLISYSLSSSGVLSGLRGTGKTHLMLLARHNINENCFAGCAHGIFCIYLNVKRLNFPKELDRELFNRIFSVFMYHEICKQLTIVLEQIKDATFFQRFFDFFNRDKKKLIHNLEAAIIKLTEFKLVAHKGNSEFSGLSVGEISEGTESHDLIELASVLRGKLSLADAELDHEWSARNLDEVTERLEKNNTYLNYLNTNTIREELVSLMQLLNLKGITFYVDEWEKISYNPDLQSNLSFYIDRILDDPIYFWISYVPYRGALHSLDNGADLQHFINLDENLVYENSKADREACLTYFREFINKRLAYYFHEARINISILFNNDANFEKLVLASMGNSRDFGTMLLKCWSEFRAYRTGLLSPGRPYQYISEAMVNAAIKNCGEKKLSNISDDPNTLKVWTDLEHFCRTKKSSHLAMEESRTNINAISGSEFSNLIYHRLLHLRKQHVPAKETSIESKLSIYALDYSSTYDQVRNKRIEFITNYGAVHDRVRRYIYNPMEIINKLQIQAGEIFPCVTCGEGIIVDKMVAAWNANSCPFCGGNIRRV